MAGAALLPGDRTDGWRGVWPAYLDGVRRGGRLREAAVPLYVVAGDWRTGCGTGRPHLPACARGRLRHYRRSARGAPDWSIPAGTDGHQGDHLGGCARFWNFGWRAGTTAHHGWGTRIAGSRLAACRR